MRADLYWVPTPFPGKLAVAPRPRGDDWLDDEMASWRRAGVDVAVSLLTPAEAAEFGLEREADAADAHGIRFASVPIPDRGTPPDPAAAADLAHRVAGWMADGRTVAVHCRQGIGRAGMVAAAGLVAAGLPPDDALARVSAARGVPVPETPDQRRWVQEFAARAVPAAPRIGSAP